MLSKKGETWITLLLFLALLPVLFLQVKTPFYIYDEGFALTGAQRVLDGEIPYRDFWSMYPPGQFYAVAAVFRLFGANILAARVYDTLVRFLLVIAVYGIARRVSTAPLAWLSAAVTGALLASLSFYAYAVFPALCLALGSIFCWLVAAESQRKGLAMLSSLLLGMALLVRWDIGAYAGISLAAAVVFYEGMRAGATRRRAAALAALARQFLPALLVAAVGYAVAGLRSGWGNLLEQVLLFPALKMREQRWLAYPLLIPGSFPPSADWMRFYAPLLVLGFAAATTAWLLATRSEARRSAAASPATAGGILLILLSALSFNQALSRYDLIHVTPRLIAALLASAALCARAQQLARKRWLPGVAAALFAALALVILLPSLQTLRQNTRAFPPWGCYSSLEKSACVSIADDQAQAVQYIQAMTHPSDALFVGNQRHDKVFVGDSGFYFLAGRPVATRYQEMHPGLVNTLAVQQEMVAELEARRPPLVVLVDIWESTEPNGSALSSGVTLLDGYLSQNYRFVTEIGTYRVLQRRPAH